MNTKDIQIEILFRKVAFQDDEQAFKKLFSEFYPALCVFSERYIDNHDVAKDIVQDTFFKIWKSRKNIDIDTSFRNFLITAVRNNCMDYLRKQNLAGRYIEKQTPFIQTPASPEDIYTLNELETMIHVALTKLPPKVREAFEMNRFKGITYLEIAEKMSVSPKTIEAYIGKALKILREELKDYLHLLAFIFYP